MSEVTIELRDENGPLSGAAESLERLLLVGPDSIHGSADAAHLNRSRVYRDMQALTRAFAIVQRRMQPTQSALQLELDGRLPADHVIAVRRATR